MFQLLHISYCHVPTIAHLNTSHIVMFQLLHISTHLILSCSNYYTYHIVMLQLLHIPYCHVTTIIHLILSYSNYYTSHIVILQLLYIRTHLGAGIHAPKWYNNIMLPLMTLTLLSVYCLFYYVLWLDFMPVNVTFVYQFLPMHYEND